MAGEFDHLFAQMSPTDIGIWQRTMQGAGRGDEAASALGARGSRRDAIAQQVMAQQQQQPQQQPSYGGGGGYGGGNPFAGQGWWSTFVQNVGPEAAMQWVAQQNMGSGPGGGGEAAGMGGSPAGGGGFGPGPFGDGNTAVGPTGISPAEANQAAQGRGAPAAPSPGLETGWATTNDAGKGVYGGWGLNAAPVSYGYTGSMFGVDYAPVAPATDFTDPAWGPAMNAMNAMVGYSPGFDSGGNGNSGIGGPGGIGGDGMGGGYGFGIGPGPGGENSVGPGGEAGPY